jgi:hypothetical protein
MDNDPFEVDWLAIEDESEQVNQLAGKKPIVAPMKKRGQTSQVTSSDESPEGVIDLKEAGPRADQSRGVVPELQAPSASAPGPQTEILGQARDGGTPELTEQPQEAP